jgi:iron complex outermembrane recepter protein
LAFPFRERESHGGDISRRRSDEERVTVGGRRVRRFSSRRYPSRLLDALKGANSKHLYTVAADLYSTIPSWRMAIDRFVAHGGGEKKGQSRAYGGQSMTPWKSRSVLRQEAFHFSSERLIASAMAASLLYIASAVADESATSTDHGIQEVIVTAERRAQSVQEVPAAVAAFSSDELTQLHASNMDELAAVVPGLEISLPYGEGGPPVYTLRGISASDFSLNQSRPIALYVDEGIRGLGALEIVPFYDIERVEVLKGPQGTLYGKNASGGAVNIISRIPGFDTEGYATLGVGNFDRRSIEAAAQTALVADVLSVRGAFQSIETDGYFKNVYPGGHDGDSTNIVSGRLSLLYKPRDDFQALLRLHDFTSNGYMNQYFARNANRAILGVDRSTLSFFEDDANRSNKEPVHNKGANLAMTYKRDAYTLTSITTYDTGDFFGGGDYDSLPVHVDEGDLVANNVKQFVQELRLQSSYHGPFNWLGGLFYSSDAVDIVTIYRFLNSPILGVLFDPNAFGVSYTGPQLYGFDERNAFTQKRESSAEYVRGEYDLVKNLTVSAGVRASKDDVRVLHYNAALGGVPAAQTMLPGFHINPLFLVPTIVDATKKASFDNVSAEAGLQYKPIKNMLLYATFKQGYRSGALNAQAFQSIDEVNVVQPEKVTAYEVGAKSEWFGRLKFNTAVFYMQYKNQQFIDQQGSLLVLANAKGARVRGVEWELEAVVADPLILSFSGSLIDPKYTSLTLLGQDESGHQLIGSAKINLNFGATWIVVKTRRGALELHADDTYTSRIYFDAFNQESLASSPFWLADARLSWNAAGGRWNLAAWGQNLFNAKYFNYAFNGSASGFGYDQTGRGRPGTYGVEFTVHF